MNWTSRAEHVIHDLKLHNDRALFGLTEEYSVYNENQLRKDIFSFWSFSTSVPSFIFAVKFLPSHVFSLLITLLIPTGELSWRVGYRLWQRLWIKGVPSSLIGILLL